MTTTVAAMDYQEICEQGRIAAQHMDKGRWIIGDLACLVETSYAGHDLDDFAREVNIGKASAKAYRTVCRFYEPARRVDYLAVNPRITYTHMRHAMRLETPDAAYAFLDECDAKGYTTDEAAYHLSKRLGNGAQSKLFDKVVSVNRFGEQVAFMCDAELETTKRYRVVVYEVVGD